MSKPNKGKLLEKIIFDIYKRDGVVVKQNAFLPPINPLKCKRNREIDILILNKLAGIDVKIAIESKNEKKKIGVPKIDSFIGKLIDVGIPPQQGIFISASGYTKDALDRAAVAGIKTLSFKDISSNTLNAIINQAIQSITYLMLDVKSISIVNNVADPGDDIKFFYDDNGNICGTIADLAWLNWKKGIIPAKIGHHKIDLKIPAEWNQRIQGHIEPIISADAEVVVYGLLVVIPGQHEEYALVDPGNFINRQFVNVKFDTDQQIYPVEAYDNEDRLRETLAKYRFRVSLKGIKLPRIKYGEMYWPPSLKTIAALSKLVKNNEIDFTQFKLENIEGSSIEAFWEPAYSRYIELFNEQYNRAKATEK
jgi:hypothetical protein